MLIGWLKATESRAKASRLCLEALKTAMPNDVVHMVRVARARARWAGTVLRQLEDFFNQAVDEAKSERPLQVLSGEGQPSESLSIPQLRLVRKEPMHE